MIHHFINITWLPLNSSSFTQSNYPRSLLQVKNNRPLLLASVRPQNIFDDRVYMKGWTNKRECIWITKFHINHLNLIIHVKKHYPIWLSTLTNQKQNRKGKAVWPTLTIQNQQFWLSNKALNYLSLSKCKPYKIILSMPYYWVRTHEKSTLGRRDVKIKNKKNHHQNQRTEPEKKNYLHYRRRWSTVWRWTEFNAVSTMASECERRMLPWYTLRQCRSFVMLSAWIEKWFGRNERNFSIVFGGKWFRRNGRNGRDGFGEISVVGFFVFFLFGFSVFLFFIE